MSNIDSLDSPFIKTGDDDNYQQLVIDNSRLGPVLVNFWSKKAGPCLRQYPILDKLVHEYNGKLLLVNVDAQHVFKITKALGISSLPTLKLYLNDEVLDTRHGFQSEDDLRAMLIPHLVRDSDAQIKQAIELYSSGDVDLALQTLANAILEDPENIRLPVTIAKLLQHQHRFQDALDLLLSLPEKDQKDNAVIQLIDRQTWLLLATDIEDLEQLKETCEASPENMPERSKLAAHYILMEDYAEALPELLSMFELDREFNDAFARKALLKVLALLDGNDPLVDQYRQALIRLSH